MKGAQRNIHTLTPSFPKRRSSCLESAGLGVYCRRWGGPWIDGGTVRLPRIVGQGRALDMILTGRLVAADEANRIGLADRVVADGEALAAAINLAKQIA